jgi:hypothetical protein
VTPCARQRTPARTRHSKSPQFFTYSTNPSESCDIKPTCIQKPGRSRESLPSCPNDAQRRALHPPRDNVNERRENRARQQDEGGRCSCCPFEEAGKGKDRVFRDSSQQLNQGIIGLLLLLLDTTY